jgi:transposase InsO family protein
MSLKREFVMLATRPGANISALCRRFQISRPTGYKWLRRYRREGLEGLRDRSRRPHTSPNQTPEPIADAVCAVRRTHPAWGGRKIEAVLHRAAEAGAETIGSAGVAVPAASEVPAASTCQAILKRRGLIDPEASAEARPLKRFERAAPNDLWQMDFKGDFPLVDGTRCHALTVIDDHSRLSLAVEACPNEQRETVQERLTAVFRRYGLPRQILCDNSLPWGVPGAARVGRPLYTELNVWLFRLGIGVLHGAPYHPQTQGKDERFHRTLQTEVLSTTSFQDLQACQRAFDRWRPIYNEERPHEGIEMDVPASRYRVSGRDFPETLPEITYPARVEVRRVSTRGQIRFRNQLVYVGQAFAGEDVAVRPGATASSLLPDAPEPPETTEAPDASTWTVSFGQIPLRTFLHPAS